MLFLGVSSDPGPPRCGFLHFVLDASGAEGKGKFPMLLDRSTGLYNSLSGDMVHLAIPRYWELLNMLKVANFQLVTQGYSEKIPS